MSMKNTNDTFGNRTCELPACSAVPQATAPPGAVLEGQTLKKRNGAVLQIYGNILLVYP